MAARIIIPREARAPGGVASRRVVPSYSAQLGAALRQAFHQALAAPAVQAVKKVPPEARPGAVAAAWQPPPAADVIVPSGDALVQAGTAHVVAAADAPPQALPAAPSLALGRPERQSLRSILALLAASGDPHALQFALTILQEEHDTVMGALKAWGEDLREQAKLAKRADARRFTLLVAAKRTQDRARQQVVARLRTCRQHIDRHLRAARPRRGVARADRHLLVTPDGVVAGAAAGRGGALLPYRTVLRPGLAPSPPAPLTGYGGFSLRAARR